MVKKKTFNAKYEATIAEFQTILTNFWAIFKAKQPKLAKILRGVTQINFNRKAKLGVDRKKTKLDFDKKNAQLRVEEKKEKNEIVEQISL